MGLGGDDPAVRPLAVAKISAPLLRAGLIDRSRVREALDASGGAALTVVAAPAGYGKTTAVRAWCGSRDAALAWVRLDGDDNDPVRLWRGVVSAVDGVRAGLGRPAMRRLSVFGGSIEGSVDELANSLATFGRDLVVVLDDFHAVTSAECVASLNHAVAAFPPSARLIVISRTDPPLRLAHLRAGGVLVELRARDLALTEAEAYRLLVRHEGIDLSAAEVRQIHKRTEGWPAALFLAALWLRSVDDPREAVRGFGGDHRFIAEYLTDEVISSLDDASRAFLLRVCVLRQFTAELCDAVLDRSDSEALLARLEQSNPFVVPLERGAGYRVHSLLAEFATHRLAALEPNAPAGIHRRASQWFRSRRRCGEAVEHAIAAGDGELVADILVEHYLHLFRTGQAQSLQRWVRTLDDEQLVGHPVLAVAGATVAMTLGRAGLDRRRYLALARRAEAECPEQVTSYVRSMVEMVRAGSVDRDVGRAVEAGRLAVEFARQDADGDASIVAALASYARALYFAGEVDDAWAMAMQAIEHPDIERRPPGEVLARTALALAAVDRGWLSSAREHAERAKSIIDDLGWNRTWLGANAAAALGCLLLSEGGLAEAESKLASAEHFFHDDLPTVPQAWLLLRLAEVRCRRGKLEQAQTTLRLAIDALESFTDGGRLPMLATDVEREIEQARNRISGGEILERPSSAELSVLRMLATNLSTRQIGEELFISPNTVRSHLRALYRKLSVNSRADAIARAEALNLLEQTPPTHVNHLPEPHQTRRA
jgi:LuxR family transcriptional regulator, maltose regulon positive regulatory protein